jgi:multidrug efflux system outer membrane protein
VKRTLAALAPLMLLAACVHAPEQREPAPDIAVPTSWSVEQARAEPPLDAWWTTFGDPELTRLIGVALERNYDLQVVAARLSAAESRAKIAGANLTPSVGARLDASRGRQNFVGFPIPNGGDVLSTTSTRLGTSIDISWEADLWGRIRAGARAGLADYQASRADFDAARLSIAGQVAKIWFAIEEARDQVQLSRRSAENFRGLADQIRARYEIGVRPALDLRLALSNLAAAESILEARRRQMDATLRQLEILVGRYPAGTLLDGLASETLPETPPPIPVGLPSELVARRPDLRATERRFAAANQRALSAHRALYPRLTLTASGGTVSTQLKDLVDGDFRVFSLAGGLLQPLFQGGRLRAEVGVAEADVAQAGALHALAVLVAFREVETALAAETFLAAQELHLTEAAEQSSAAERLAAEQYRFGVGGYLEVLESQTRSFTSRSALLQLKRERLDNRIDLHLALGGGFETDEPAPGEIAKDDPS